jgi:membrane protein DedA with SNARE-associated domain
MRSTGEGMILHWVAQYGYFGLFSLLTLGILGLPIPDEVVLTFSGYLTYRGDLLLIPTIVTAFLGSSCGITLSYGLGRTVGLYLVHRWGPLVRISPAHIERTHEWFRRIGHWSLVFGYFIPGIRHLTALVAGATKLEAPIFALYAYSGALIWSLTFITLGYFLGEKWTWVVKVLQSHLGLGILIALGIIAIYLLTRMQINSRNTPQRNKP